MEGGGGKRIVWVMCDPLVNKSENVTKLTTVAEGMPGNGRQVMWRWTIGLKASTVLCPLGGMGWVHFICEQNAFKQSVTSFTHSSQDIAFVKVVQSVG